MLSDGSVELWQVLDESGADRPLARIPPDLEMRYSEVERDRSYDPFSLVLRLAPGVRAPDKPDWQADVDFKAGTFAVSGSAEAVPEDLDHAFRALAPHRFVELQRTEEGGNVRIEGVIVDG